MLVLALKLTILQIVSDAHSKQEMVEKIVQTQSDRAVRLAWSMFKCVPPLVACQPAKFSVEWHETMPAYWTDLEGPYGLVYYKPVLLFTPYGPDLAGTIRSCLLQASASIHPVWSCRRESVRLAE